MPKQQKWLEINILALVLYLGASVAFAGSEVKLSAADQEDLAITIYNGGIAQVRDVRKLKLPAGVSKVHFGGVSARIRPSTALLEAGGLSLIEQNFDYDLLTPQKLLSKAVGQTVRIYRTHPTTGVDTVEEALVLSAEQGAVLRIGNRIEILSASGLPGRIVFEKIPPNLRAEPTLSMTLRAAEAFDDRVELTYLTGGLTWRADYVGQLDKDGTELDLQAWITLNNSSGVAYRNAALKLLAGNVNQVRAQVRALQTQARARQGAVETSRREQLGDYHLYTVPERTTIRHNQQKQVALFHASGVKVRKEYRITKSGNWARGSDVFDNAETRIHMANTKKAGLGLPIPQGIMRFYMDDVDGNAQFVGEDRVRNLPVDRGQWFTLGQAFDLTVSHERSFYEETCRVVNKRRRCTYEVELVATLKNAKKEPATINYRKIFGAKWEMVSESAKSQKEDDRTVFWQVEIPAGGEIKLTYRYRDGLLD